MIAAPGARPDRRLAPRPLPAHLASAMLLWLSSRAGLTSLNAGLPPWKGDDRLRAFAAEAARLGPEAVAAALERLVRRRAAALAAGLGAYRRHPRRRADETAPVRWQQGAARLLDYGAAGAPAVLVVPSLINRHYILDLVRERSFVRHLAARGLRPLVLDWGEPGAAERGFALDDYIGGPLDAAIAAAAGLAGRPVALAGYCMGGLLALAGARRRPAAVAALLLLAAPWDFHAERAAQARLLAALIEAAPPGLDGVEPVPVWLLQALFMMLDPLLAERKFVHFAGLDPASPAARDFVALEDWINDGVPLARRVALDCARLWYRDNAPMRGLWHVAGMPVRPEEVAAPTLVVLPSRDKIVPPRAAAPLAALIPGAAALSPRFGHIGMMASAQAPATVWQPIAEWLRTRFA